MRPLIKALKRKPSTATQQMLEIWAADDPAAGRAALRAIQARVDLWDSILSSVSDLPGADGL